MAAGGFLSRSAPVEIILRIFQCCHSTRDLLALISTCRHVYHVWRGNAAAALWPVWLREIPHFQDALTAARMTELVVEAERRGECPPTRITPDQLEQQRQQPTLSELRAAFALHRLSRAIAACLCSQHLTLPEDREDWRLGPSPPPEDPARMPEWTARVSHSVFRLLIVGAALAGAYMEPLVKAFEHPDPEVRALPRRVPEWSPQEWSRDTLNEKELAFLLQFAVCDLDAPLEAQDAVFGPIADWLLESILSDKEARQAMADRFEQRRGRATYCLELERYEDEEMLCPLSLLEDGRGSHSDAHLVVWELMKMLWLVDKVHGRYGECALDRHTARPPSTTTERGDAADEHNQRPLESAVAVFFGTFRAEETLLTTSPDKYGREYLMTYPAVDETKEEEGHGDGKKLPSTKSVTVFFDYLFNHSGRPNSFETASWQVPPLELEFFDYFLQRHLGLCLHCGAFRDDPGGEHQLLYEQFVGTAAIFSHDDVEKRSALDGDYLEFAGFLDGSEMLTKYPPDLERVYFPGWD